MTAAHRVRNVVIGLAVVLGICGLALGEAAPQVYKAYKISSASMENTLMRGDFIFVRPLEGQKIARGEIVEMLYPLDRSQVYIKRVAAVGGDRVRFRDKTFILNGSPVDEPYAVHSTTYVDPFRDNFPAIPDAPLPSAWADYLTSHIVNGEIVVPEGKYFVLGDNRDDSADSRYWGFVDRKDIVGTPVMIYFSEKPEGGVRWDRMFRKF